MNDHKENAVRVMIVDDDRATRTGWMMMLKREADILVASQASNGSEAVEYLRRSEHELPDVILMDVRMPVMDGIEATGLIKEEFPEIRILILTTYDEDEYAIDSLSRGASGFLLKDATHEQLHSAIMAVCRGDAVLTPRITGEMIKRDLRRIRDVPNVSELRARFSKLTPREYQVAAWIALGLSNEEIADRLTIANASVRRSVSRILEKLRLRDRLQVAIVWYKIGMDQFDQSSGAYPTGMADQA